MLKLLIKLFDYCLSSLFFSAEYDILYFFSDSDISKDQSAFEAEHHLMDKVGLVEGALSELTHDHHLSVTVGNFIHLHSILSI